MFIGEAPGRDEDRFEVPFVGKTGVEVNEHYLPLAGLSRKSSYFTNAIKCWPVSNGGKLDTKRGADRALLDSCALTHLNQEILELEPRLLVPMGAFACLAVDPSIDLQLQHGIPQQTQWDIPAFPMHHPARGLHEPKKMLELRQDWIRLRQYLAGKLVIREDEYPNPDYAEVTDADEIACIDYSGRMALDTETSPQMGPYFLTYSVSPGTGRLIRASRTDLLTYLQAVLSQWEGSLIFHHYLYDQKIISAMGLRVPSHVVRDTMVRAFHLGCLPQGLKDLSYRELGMRMKGFEDVVKPHSVARVLDYYRLAQTIDWPKPEPEMERAPDGTWKIKKPQGMNTKLKRFFTDYGKNPEKDVFEMFTKNWVKEQAALIEHCGEFPHMDIAHAPFEEALFYACRDSDATLRLDPVLDQMELRLREGLPVEQWRM